MGQSEIASESCFEVDGIRYTMPEWRRPMISIREDLKTNTVDGWDVPVKYWGNPDKAIAHDLRYTEGFLCSSVGK